MYLFVPAVEKKKKKNRSTVASSRQFSAKNNPKRRKVAGQALKVFRPIRESSDSPVPIGYVIQLSHPLPAGYTVIY